MNVKFNIVNPSQPIKAQTECFADDGDFHFSFGMLYQDFLELEPEQETQYFLADLPFSFVELNASGFPPVLLFDIEESPC